MIPLRYKDYVRLKVEIPWDQQQEEFQGYRCIRSVNDEKKVPVNIRVRINISS